MSLDDRSAEQPRGSAPLGREQPVPAPVVLLCRDKCAKCMRVQRWIESLGVPMEVRDVVTDLEARETVTQLGFSSLPVVVTPDGRSASGWNPRVLAQQLPYLGGRITYAPRS